MPDRPGYFFKLCMRMLIIDDEQFQMAGERLAMACQTMARSFRDIALVVVLPGEPENVQHAKQTIEKALDEIKPILIKYNPESQSALDQKNKPHWKPNIPVIVRNGYPVKNARCMHTWTPRKYITKKGVAVMRMRKNDN